MKTLEQRAAHAAYMRDYWRRNPEKYRAMLQRQKASRDPATNRARVAAWRFTNPEACAEQNRRKIGSDAQRRANRKYQAKRRALTLGIDLVDPVDYSAILDECGMTCHICGESIGEDDLQFDHVIPLARGGPHIAMNIRPAHALCNRRKGAKYL